MAAYTAYFQKWYQNNNQIKGTLITPSLVSGGADTFKLYIPIIGTPQELNLTWRAAGGAPAQLNIANLFVWYGNGQKDYIGAYTPFNASGRLYMSSRIAASFVTPELYSQRNPAAYTALEIDYLTGGAINTTWQFSLSLFENC